jgi:membrane associated rhomboid family serine protease
MNDPLSVVLLIVATCGISMWAFQRPDIEERFIFRPERILAGKEYYRLVTSAFLHSGWTHLLLNMYALYGFAGGVAYWFGGLQFFVIYFGSVLGGNLLSLFLHRHHDYAAYGASGGVCGVIFAYILRFPNSHMMIFPIPYAVPGWVYALAFIIASFYAMKQPRDNIGHDAHLGGAIIGLLITAGLHPELPRQNWLGFSLLLLGSGLILVYIAVNPMFLPMTAFVQKRPLTAKSRRPARAPIPRGEELRSPGRRRSAADDGYRPPPPKDWLLQEIEVQVGKLEKDQTGAHAWVDKFGRTYDWITAQADRFDLQAYTADILNRLNRPDVKFVVVDTRGLREEQVALVRRALADLPDAQFNRVIRSFSFKGR